MADEVNAVNADADQRAQLKEEKKRLKEEQKAQRKEAKKRAREIELAEDELDENSGGGSGSMLLVTFIIVAVWLAILALLIKLDVGGIGSGILAPVLSNVPVINKVLPGGPMAEGGSTEEYGGYTSLEDAVAQIKRLELELENIQSLRSEEIKNTDELWAEIERLKTFEDNQVAFEKIKNEFYNEVVYADKGPGAEAYQKYFESMDPATAQEIYRQVVTKNQEDEKVKAYAQAYSEMKADQAAKIFEEMTDDLNLVAKILYAMEADVRGKILGAMDPAVSARLTKIMDPAY